jgi:O-acetylserine/cysteine efflux transporter
VSGAVRAADLRLLLVAVVLFGGAWPISKHALVDATPLWFAIARAGGAALVATLLLLALRRLRWPHRADWPAVLAVGTLQLAVFFALAHLALDLVPAGRTAILSNVTIFWLVPLSVWLLGDRVSGTRWIAAALGLAGALALIGPWAVPLDDTPALLGHAMLLAAALSWSVAIVLTRLHPPRSTMLELLPFCFLLATVLLLPLALWREPQGRVGPGAWWQAAFVGLVAAPLGTWCVIEAGRRLPGLVASLGFLLAPAIGVIIGAAWLGEPVGWDIWIGGALIVASVAVAARG